DLSNTSGCLWRRFLTSKNSKKNSKRYYRLSDTNTALIFIDYLYSLPFISVSMFIDVYLRLELPTAGSAIRMVR
ncbi:hypothetical protein EZS27_041949, partial [termite gut metagenome]